MIYITLFSFIVTLIIVGWWLYTYWPFSLRFNKTFWYHKAYSVTLWMIDDGYRRKDYRSAHGIITMAFRNQEKLDEWDSNKFKEDKARGLR